MPVIAKHVHLPLAAVVAGATAIGSAGAGTVMVTAPIGAPLPDGSVTGVASGLMVEAPPSAVVAGVQVALRIDHPWVGDLVATLSPPGGAFTVQLLDCPGTPSEGFPGPFGCGGDDIDALFDDAAAVEAETVCSTTEVPVIAGPVRPLDPLAQLHGTPASGIWTVTVADVTGNDAGTWQEVTLTLTLAVDPTCSGDIDGDGEVGFTDLSALLAAWGVCTGCAADLDGDDVVGFTDLSALLAAWGAC